jgi:hypothetical protein
LIVGNVSTSPKTVNVIASKGAKLRISGVRIVPMIAPDAGAACRTNVKV